MTEVVVLCALMTFLVLTLAPAIAKSRPTSKSMGCLNNLRQLAGGWTMYATDYGDRVANNFGVTETSSSISAGRLENWANNVMTWGASTAVTDRSNTNVLWLTRGVLGGYFNGQIKVYKCPSDTYLSSPQRALGWTARLRSYSMNSVFGRFSTGADSTQNGVNWAFPEYAQYLTRSRVPKPLQTWLFMEEHSDSINDGYYVNNPTAYGWQDIPASGHEGGAGISFADGHTELKRWRSATSWYRVQFSYTSRAFDPLGRADFAWYLSRTGYQDARTGQLLFGY